MDMMQKFLFGLTCFFWSWGILFAQSGDKSSIRKRGLPLMKSYTLTDYPVLAHNHQIAQGERGIIFIANDNGLVEFDGINWRQHQTPEQSSLKALACVKDRIYVGGNGDLGYFAPDKQANFTFVSLVPQVKQFNFPLPVFTKVIATGSQVIFFSAKGLYLYEVETQRFKYIASRTKFLNIFQSATHLFIQESNRGLFLLKEKKLVPLIGSEVLSSKRVQCILPYNQTQFLIGTQHDGIYVYDGQGCTEWKRPINTTLKATQLYQGIPLSQNYFALSTFDEGLLLLDRQGNIVQKISKQFGLPSNVISSLFLDDQQRLWLGFAQGVTQIDVFSPLRVYNQKQGLVGIPYDAIQFQGALYVGTSQGLFRLDSQELSGQFVQVPRSKGVNQSLVKVSNQCLLSGHAECLLKVEKKQVSVLPFRGNVMRITPLDTVHRNTWLVFTKDGLYTVNINQGKISAQVKVKGLPIVFDESTRVVIDTNGFVWTSNANQGVLRLKLTNEADSIQNVRLYGKATGLPSSANNRVFRIQEQLVVATKKGLFQYNATKDQFEPYH